MCDEQQRKRFGVDPDHGAEPGTFYCCGIAAVVLILLTPKVVNGFL